MNHTPGPWIYEVEEPYEPSLVTADWRKVPGVRVWLDDAPDSDFNIIAEANGRLIAAAPELAEALDAILNHNSLIDWIDKDKVEFARAALKKAGFS